MKKTFPLTAANHQPARVVEQIKSDVRKKPQARTQEVAARGRGFLGLQLQGLPRRGVAGDQARRGNRPGHRSSSGRRVRLSLHRDPGEARAPNEQAGRRVTHPTGRMVWKKHPLSASARFMTEGRPLSHASPLGSNFRLGQVSRSPEHRCRERSPAIQQPPQAAKSRI